MKPRASIYGGSGYIGGEILRLLLGHPGVQVFQVTSESKAGEHVHMVHPNLYKSTDLKFSHPDSLERCDILFLCGRHGESSQRMERFAALSPRIIDCSADFRLSDPGVWKKWYGMEHPAKEWLGKFVYGLPEINRESIKGADYVSGVGCNATATILALLPLKKAGLLGSAVADIKVGSSEAGARPRETSHHPLRSGTVRVFAGSSHRHQAEVSQALGKEIDISFTVTSVGMVRGVFATCHAFLSKDINEKELWRIFRECYGEEPFVRIFKRRKGLFRLPEPKWLMGTNFCDVGFEKDMESSANRVIVFSALDNLGKGGAGTAIQCMNLMMGFPEREGLGFTGLYPI